MNDSDLEVQIKCVDDFPVTDAEMTLLADLLPGLIKGLLLAEGDAESVDQQPGVQE